MHSKRFLPAAPLASGIHSSPALSTRSQRADAIALSRKALHAVIDSPAKYIGLIGSKSKIKLIYDDLHEKGISLERLQKVHAPIGYEIGAITVPEIAVSIAAELIAIRRGRTAGAPSRALRLPADDVEKWVTRKTDKVKG